jgi:hypothetical protein
MSQLLLLASEARSPCYGAVLLLITVGLFELPRQCGLTEDWLASFVCSEVSMTHKQSNTSSTIADSHQLQHAQQQLQPAVLPSLSGCDMADGLHAVTTAMMQEAHSCCCWFHATTLYGNAITPTDWPTDLLVPIAVSACMRVRRTSSGCGTDNNKGASSIDDQSTHVIGSSAGDQPLHEVQVQVVSCCMPLQPELLQQLQLEVPVWLHSSMAVVRGVMLQMLLWLHQAGANVLKTPTRHILAQNATTMHAQLCRWPDKSRCSCSCS